MSWGSGESSTGLPWLRNCEEPCERFCLCALRTDFRVKPSTFSAAEMAADMAGRRGGSSRAYIVPEGEAGGQKTKGLKKKTKNQQKNNNEKHHQKRSPGCPHTPHGRGEERSGLCRALGRLPGRSSVPASLAVSSPRGAAGGAEGGRRRRRKRKTNKQTQRQLRPAGRGRASAKLSLPGSRCPQGRRGASHRGTGSAAPLLPRSRFVRSASPSVEPAVIGRTRP